MLTVSISTKKEFSLPCIDLVERGLLIFCILFLISVVSVFHLSRCSSRESLSTANRPTYLRWDQERIISQWQIRRIYTRYKRLYTYYKTILLNQFSLKRMHKILCWLKVSYSYVILYVLCTQRTLSKHKF